MSHGIMPEEREGTAEDGEAKGKAGGSSSA